MQIDINGLTQSRCKMFKSITTIIYVFTTLITLAACSGSDTPNIGGIADSIAPTFAGATSAGVASSNSIQVNWNAASDNISDVSTIKYNVYSSLSSAAQTFASATMTVTGTTNAIVTGLSNTETYYFVVRAEDEAGNEDDNSVEVSATTAATSDTTAPTFAGATSAGFATATSIQISWDVASDNISDVSTIKYNIYSSLNSAGQSFTTATKTVIGTTNTIITGLTSGLTYYFVVRAEDGTGNEDNNTVEVSDTTVVIAKSFMTDIQPIFTTNCTTSSCHDSNAPAASLDLTSGMAYSELVDVASLGCASSGGRNLITANDTANSYLIDKLSNTNICAGSGMPLIGDALSDSDIQAIISWVNEGALNN